jgi:heme oxygenase
MASLLHGRLDKAGYVQLLGNLHAIYEHLEAGVRHNARLPELAVLDLAPLFRCRAIEQDLRVLQGPRWREQRVLVRAAQDFAQHLQALSRQQPRLLAAHAYVRYLGDLSGGQMLARVVARSLRLEPGQAVGFYHFGDAAAVQERKQAFRAALEGLAGNEVLAGHLVEEACSSFTRHKALFEQLDAAAPVA